MIMEYAVRNIDINDTSTRAKVTSLMNEVFETRLSEDKLLRNTATRNMQSVYLGAFKGDELAAVNFFIAHEIQLNNQTLIAHQSCWSATSPKHRKKGLFSLLINTAKEQLMASGSAFIFGFPNQNSEPIFILKLGFRKCNMSKINIPVKLLSRLFLMLTIKQKDQFFLLETANCLIPVESEIIELKENEYGADVKVFGAYNNLIWGKTKSRKTRWGALSFFIVGGIQVNKPGLLPELFRALVRQEKPDVIQVAGVANSSLWSLFNGVKAANRIEPLIVYDLNSDTTTSKFNFFTGIKDVF